MQKRLISILTSRMAPKPPKSGKKDLTAGEKEKPKESAISVLKSGDVSLKM